MKEGHTYIKDKILEMMWYNFCPTKVTEIVVVYLLKCWLDVINVKPIYFLCLEIVSPLERKIRQMLVS